MTGLQNLKSAARDSSPVSGHTHGAYKYPARFSPVFVRAAIEQFTKPGDLVVDPFMGGATSLVEARAAGRLSLGSDVSELAVFVAKIKTRGLHRTEGLDLLKWSSDVAHEIQRGASRPTPAHEDFIEPNTFRNLRCSSTSKIVRAVAYARDRVTDLSSKPRQDFGRCILLRTAQIAINGNRDFVSVRDLGSLLVRTSERMISDAVAYRNLVRKSEREKLGNGKRKSRIIRVPASKIHTKLRTPIERASLVVTSPPYPGINVLYHRWQLNGGKETALPFWITGTRDGRGNAFYQMNARAYDGLDRYYSEIRASFASVRQAIAESGTLVQIVGFSNPRSQLPRYLRAMSNVGFEEISDRDCSGHRKRIVRYVPGRNWHAQRKGKTESSKEFVLIHRPV